MSTRHVVQVPDVPRPTQEICWKQKLDPPGAMERCDRMLGHGGLHSWELYWELRRLAVLCAQPSETQNATTASPDLTHYPDGYHYDPNPQPFPERR